jgi:CRP/FNR family transcriptional regulator
MEASTDWLDHFPLLKDIKDPVWQDVIRTVHQIKVPEGHTVFRAGDHCDNYLLVINGSVRVQKVSENGKEIVLYRVGDGDSCVLTTSCLLAHERYQAEAITESVVTAVVIPSAMFHKALSGSQKFREFVFACYGQRIADLLSLVDAVAFQRMDSRLAHVLLQQPAEDGVIRITHQDLARELGTAREVISRLLKSFEHNHWVELGRGSVTLLNKQALEQSAQLKER